MFITHPVLVKHQPPHAVGLFESDASVSVLNQPDMWALASPLVFLARGQGTITIPTGTTTDLASTPRALDWLPWMDRDGDSRLPGILHDGIYRLGREKGKPFADSILHEACLDVGMSPLEAAIYYKGVAWFGRGGWNADASHVNYGPLNSNFVDQATYDAWMKAGGTIYSKDFH